jgi:hypothetical protein
MANQESVARKQSGSERDKHGTAQNGDEDDVARYEQELAGYLQERIKPRLNSGAIPLLARSIAKEIAHWDAPNGASKAADDEPSAEADDEPDAEAEEEPEAEAGDEPDAEAEADDEPEAESDDEPSAEGDDESSADGEAQQSDFEADMHELQAELGEDWILSFSVKGDDGWLTAEKDDGSQRVEAPTAAVLSEAVGLLNEGGGRSA